MLKDHRRWISGVLACAAIGWAAALVGCVNESGEEVGEDTARLGEDGGSGDGGMPNCTFPEVDECLEGCGAFDEAEAAYQRNPLDGKIARYDTTFQSTTLTWFDKKAVFESMRGPTNDAAKATLKGGKEFVGKTCKLIPVVAEAYNAGEAVFNMASALSQKDYCVCPTVTKFKRMRWSCPQRTAQCTRTRECWDPARKAKTHETYLSGATYHEDNPPAHDGTYMDDWEIKREGNCSAWTHPTVTRYRSDGSYYYPIVEASCGGYSKVYDVDTMNISPGDNTMTALKLETCSRWCAQP